MTNAASTKVSRSSQTLRAIREYEPVLLPLISETGARASKEATKRATLYYVDARVGFVLGGGK